MKNYKCFLSFLALSFTLNSCNTDDNDSSITNNTGGMDGPASFDNGFLISHEGAFDGGFGTVSFIDSDLTASENGIYQSINNDMLGGIVQSITFSDDFAYVISNLSNRVTVVNRFTFEEIARIEDGLSNPRYMTIANGKGYITNWGDGSIATDDYIAVINLTDNEVQSTVSVGEGPEQIVYDGNSIYVSHKGGFSVNNILTVISPELDTVDTTIIVGDAPDEMEIDSEGNLWVLSEGAPSFQGTETGGRVTKIDPATNQLLDSVVFEDTTHPSLMDVEGDTVYYYINGSLFSVGINEGLSDENDPILENLSFFGMSIIDTQVIGCNAGDFAGNGTIEVYDLSSTELTATLGVGIIPAKVYPNF